MAAGKFLVTTKAKEYIGDNTIDLDHATAGGGYKARLVNKATDGVTNILGLDLVATSWVATSPSSNGGATDVSLGSGYTWTASGTTLMWDCPTSLVWTAAGGTMSATHVVIFADYQTSPVDPVVCVAPLNQGTTAGVDVTSGNTLTVTFATSGIIRLSGATSAT